MLGTVVKPVSGVVDLVSKTTEGIESSVDGGICYKNDKQVRKPRAFYKEAGVFKEYSHINAMMYDILRGVGKPKPANFASLDDVYYGAFKLGGSPDESVMDADIMLLTSRFLVRLDKDCNMLQKRHTDKLDRPTKD